MSRKTGTRPSGGRVNHCAELLVRRSPEKDQLEAFGAFAGRLGAGIAREWVRIGNGTSSQIEITPPRTISTETLAEAVGPLAGNLLIPVGNPAMRLLASFPVAPLQDSLERMLGGAAPRARAERADAGNAARSLPRSLQLLLRRLQDSLCTVLADLLAPEGGEAVGEPRLDTGLASLAPFPERAELAVVDLSFGGGEAAPVEMSLACRMVNLPRLLQLSGGAGAGAATNRDEVAASVAGIPLSLRARLVDMTVPMSRLAALEVGAVLPVAIARSVPLMVGERTIATGTVGELDDRIALCIDHNLIDGESR